MSIIKLDQSRFQNYKIVANPKRIFQFVSGSSYNSGSVPVFVDASKSLKDLDPTFAVDEYDSSGLEKVRSQVIQDAVESNKPNGDKNIFSTLEAYMDGVRSHPLGERQLKLQEVRRYEPGVKLDKNFMSKSVIKNSLFPYYRKFNPDLYWSYNNYNCLNFSSNEVTHKDSAIIYRCSNFEGFENNVYAPSSSFSFDFWIKPKTNQKNPSEHVTAGTVLHMSSCYAISVITGSSKGPNGLSDKYRILLQLSQSSEIPPSEFYFDDNGNLLTNSNVNPDYAWVSSDNSLDEGSWNHINVSWGGNNSSDGFGHIAVNGKIDKTFQINQETIMQVNFDSLVSSDPDVLILGNFFEGDNKGPNSQQGFFNSNVSIEQGLTPYTFENDPLNFAMNHPLNAEVHDIKIFNRAIPANQINRISKNGSSLTENLIFYVPVLFTKFSRNRKILQTPFQSFYGSTEDPFNVSMSFSIGGYELNLENFVREFVRGEYPRLYKMVTPQRETPVFDTNLTSNDIVYGLHETDPSLLRNDQKISRKRLYSILPCDNGEFKPNYNLLSGSLNPISNQILGFLDKSKIDLNNLVPMINTFASIQTIDSLDGEDGELISQLFGDITPENPGEPGMPTNSILTILRRTLDPSSNEVAIFDVSNLFYGDRILPNSLVMIDEDPYLLDGREKFILKDDGLGRIYRANSKGKLATWNCIGNILYEEGLIILKSPHIRFFGRKEFTIEFRGERNIHVLEISIPVDYNQFNISANSSYKALKPSQNKNDIAEKFTYVTGINLHDDNLNIIGRANLAQPVAKRDEDKFVIKLRMDF